MDNAERFFKLELSRLHEDWLWESLGIKSRPKKFDRFWPSLAIHRLRIQAAIAVHRHP